MLKKASPSLYGPAGPTLKFGRGRGQAHGAVGQRVGGGAMAARQRAYCRVKNSALGPQNIVARVKRAAARGERGWRAAAAVEYSM